MYTSNCLMSGRRAPVMAAFIDQRANHLCQSATIKGAATKEYQDVGEIIADYTNIKKNLEEKYEEMMGIYNEILSLLKRDRVLDNTANTEAYINEARSSIIELLDTNFKKEVKEKFAAEDIYYDSVFFLPIIDKVFNLTQI